MLCVNTKTMSQATDEAKHLTDEALAGTKRLTVTISCVAVGAGVLGYMCARGLRVSWTEFAICVPLLLCTLLALITPQRANDIAKECFSNLTTALTDQLDRMITGMAGRDEASQPQVRKVEINAAWLNNNPSTPDGQLIPTADVDAMKLVYKRINALLCSASEGAPKLYENMMSALKAPDPSYDISDEGEEGGNPAHQLEQRQRALDEINASKEAAARSNSDLPFSTEKKIQ